MAEEFVSKELFGEFVKRMDDRFDAQDKRIEDGFAHANQLADQRYDSINQRLADAEKAREQGFVHVNQRFDDMNQRFDDMNHRFDDMNHPFDDMNRSMNHRFDNLEKRFDDLRKIVLIMLAALVSATVVSVVGAAVKYIFFPG